MTITDKLLMDNEIFRNCFLAVNSNGKFQAERESFVEFKFNPEGPMVDRVGRGGNQSKFDLLSRSCEEISEEAMNWNFCFPSIKMTEPLNNLECCLDFFSKFFHERSSVSYKSLKHSNNPTLNTPQSTNIEKFSFLHSSDRQIFIHKLLSPRAYR